MKAPFQKWKLLPPILLRIDLVVRVAGYSAYFTQLNSAMQDEVIARAESSLANT
jgi:hypothetical protein